VTIDLAHEAARRAISRIERVPVEASFASALSARRHTIGQPRLRDPILVCRPPIGLPARDWLSAVASTEEPARTLPGSCPNACIWRSSALCVQAELRRQAACCERAKPHSPHLRPGHQRTRSATRLMDLDASLTDKIEPRMCHIFSANQRTLCSPHGQRSNLLLLI